MATKERPSNAPTKAGILDHVTDIVITTDMDLRIIAWNKEAEKVYGRSEKEALGKKISENTADKKSLAR